MLDDGDRHGGDTLGDGDGRTAGAILVVAIATLVWLANAIA